MYWCFVICKAGNILEQIREILKHFCEADIVITSSPQRWRSWDSTKLSNSPKISSSGNDAARTHSQVVWCENLYFFLSHISFISPSHLPLRLYKLQDNLMVYIYPLKITKEPTNFPVTNIFHVAFMKAVQCWELSELQIIEFQ